MVSILIRTILVYLILNIMLKLMGKRQIGELEVNELVSALLISEIAAIPISDTDAALLPSMIPIIFVSALEVIVSVIKNRSAKVKKIVEGIPSYIIYKGRLRQNALRENRISINEVMTDMRIQGIGDIRDIEYGILESNGKISFLKKEDKLNISQTLVLDAEIDQNNIRELGINEEWIHNQLKKQGLKIDDVFLLTISDDKSVYIIEKDKEK